MQLSQLGLTLFNLREHCQTETDLRASLAKVKAIGFEVVQVSAVKAISPEVVHDAIVEAGLICCATHEPGTMIRENPAGVVEKLSILNTEITAFPHPGQVDLEDAAAVRAMIADLDKAGSVLAEAGQTLCYHNHALEFFRPNGGPSILEQIYRETSPDHLKAELDTYWVQAGGGDVVQWIGRMKDRLPILHIKDFTVTSKGEFYMTEIGAGHLDWPRIIAAGEEAGCEWFVIEQDRCPGDPFESMKKSFDYVTSHLLGS